MRSGYTYELSVFEPYTGEVMGRLSASGFTVDEFFQHEHTVVIIATSEVDLESELRSWFDVATHGTGSLRRISPSAEK